MSSGAPASPPADRPASRVIPGLVQVQVVNYLRTDLTLACIESIRRQTYANRRILVIDNASTEESRLCLQGAGGDFALIANKENLGWGAGHNAGFAYAGFPSDPEYYLVVNNDAELAPDCLSELVETLESHPGCAIASPMIYKDASRSAVDNVGFNLSYRYFVPLDWGYIAGDHRRHFRSGSRQVTWSDDTVSLMRRGPLLSAAGYDESFFMYVDETDLAYRLGRMGHAIRVNYRAVAYHGGKGSSRGEVSVFSLRCKFRNWYRFHRKHFGALHLPYVWLWLASMYLLKACQLVRSGRAGALAELTRALAGNQPLPGRSPRPPSPAPGKSRIGVAHD